MEEKDSHSKGVDLAVQSQTTMEVVKDHEHHRDKKVQFQFTDDQTKKYMLKVMKKRNTVDFGMKENASRLGLYALGCTFQLGDEKNKDQKKLEKDIPIRILKGREFRQTGYINDPMKEGPNLANWQDFLTKNGSITVDILVTCAESPDCFYFVINEWHTGIAYRDIQKYLIRAYDGANAHVGRSHPHEYYEVGGVYAAKVPGFGHRGDKGWARVQLTELCEDKEAMVNVALIDHGGYEFIPFQDLRPLQLNVGKRFPRRAYRGELSIMKTPKVSQYRPLEYSKNEKTWFKDLVVTRGGKFQAIIVGVQQQTKEDGHVEFQTLKIVMTYYDEDYKINWISDTLLGPYMNKPKYGHLLRDVEKSTNEDSDEKSNNKY